MSPAVERDDRPVADLDDVVVTCSDLAVGVWDAEGPVDFFCQRARGVGTRGHHAVGPYAGIDHGPIALGAEGRADVPAIAVEDDAAHEGTALRHVAELDAQAPALDDGRDLELAGRPALASLFAAELPSGVMLVVAHPDAKAACERVEPLDQIGLRLTGFGVLAELGHQGGEVVLGRRPGCWHVLLHRTMSASAVFLDEPVIRPDSFRML